MNHITKNLAKTNFHVAKEKVGYLSGGGGKGGQQILHIREN